jgi:hypothetical protein
MRNVPRLCGARNTPPRRLATTHGTPNHGFDFDRQRRAEWLFGVPDWMDAHAFRSERCHALRQLAWLRRDLRGTA